MTKKKKGKPKRAQKAHEEEEGDYWEVDWNDYKTFEEWHREAMRTIAEDGG